MRLNYYETLIKVVESGSITETARELFISQPAVSKQIKALENHYTTQLINRDTKKITLTEDGKIVYEFALRTINNDNSIRSGFCEEEIVGGELLILGSNIPSYCYIPSILSNYLEEYKNIRPVIDILPSSEVLENVKKGIVAFGFVGSIGNEEKIEYVKVFEEDMVLVANSNYEQITIGRKMLRKARFACREVGSATQESFQEYLSKYSVELNEENTLFTCKDNEMVKRTVLKNDVIAFLPKCCIQEEINSGKITVLDNAAKRDFYYIYNVESHMCVNRRSFHEYVISQKKGK